VSVSATPSGAYSQEDDPCVVWESSQGPRAILPTVDLPLLTSNDASAELDGARPTLCLSADGIFVQCSSAVCGNECGRGLGATCDSGSLFGIVDGSAASGACLVAVVPNGCGMGWRTYSDDVMPLDPKAYWFIPEDPLDVGGPRGVCVTPDRISLGLIPANGSDADGCCVTQDGVVFCGWYTQLLSWRAAQDLEERLGLGGPEATRDDETTMQACASPTSLRLGARFSDLVSSYMTTADYATIENITGTNVDATLSSLLHTSRVVAPLGLSSVSSAVALPCLIDRDVLSAKRFVPHPLNAHGLHLIRCLLAERVLDARRQALGLDSHPLYAEWHKAGVLRLDFDKIVDSDLQRILKMAVSGQAVEEELSFVERPVTHMPGDSQYEFHVDTFHQVVKLWVYYANVTEAMGPLYIIPGSHHNTPGKLRWLFNLTAANVAQAVVEPSLRFLGRESELDFPPALPVLPLPGVARTLIIADTSALHRRGMAAPGLVRAQLRPRGLANDGGVPRQDPFAAWPSEAQPTPGE